MLQKIVNTENQITGTLLRVALASSILPHGIQKLINFTSIHDALQTHYGLPSALAILVIGIEFLCPILLVFGLFTRINAILLGFVLLGASYYHLDHGFYINWMGNQTGEGIQFHLLYIVTACALVNTGGGKWSIDFVLKSKVNK